MFATLAINASGANGLFYGNPRLLVVQLAAIAVVAAYAFIGSFLLLRLTGFFVSLRVSPEEEEKGLDSSQHGEEAYN